MTGTQTKIIVVGVGPTGIDPAGLDLLRSCPVAVASSRHRDLVPVGTGIIPIAPVKEALSAIEAALGRGDVAVLASGDPLFFGIGRTLVERFGADRVEVVPALSAMQLLCARCRIPWDDAVFMSLHGRPLGDAATALLMGKKTVVFTDGRNTPAKVAAAMLERLTACGCADLEEEWRLIVGEELGSGRERVSRLGLAEASAREFAPLNLMLVENTGRGSARPGFPGEDEIVHSRGLITKDEVRAVVMARLAPPESGVLWDVGAGSGSVGLAAAIPRPELRVFAVERRESELENIRANIRRFAAFNILPVAGRAPGILPGLPDPDRVFVGGSGGELGAIIETAHARLRSGGRMVVNAVLDRTEKEAIAMMTGLGMDPEASRIAVTRRGRDGAKEMNPITVITGIKE